MDKQLRDLAFLIMNNQTIEKSRVEKLIEKLTKKQLSQFLTYLKAAQEKNTINITAGTDVEQYKDFFNKNYPEMQKKYIVDDTMGGGVIVKIGDDVYDYSVRNYIHTTINKLNNTL